VVPSAARGVKTHKNVDHRVRSGWLDGLRQLGVRVLPEHTLGGDLPDGLRYAAVWMVKRRKDGPTRLPKHVPVAVLVTPAPEGGGLARIQGWDDEAREWIPYPAFLLRLVKMAEISLLVEPGEAPTEAPAAALTEIPAQRTDSGTVAEPNNDAAEPVVWVTTAAWRKNLEEQRKETARFLQRMLLSLRGAPTALITHSQNSRLHWPWLQDGRLIADLIKTGHAQPSGLDSELRLIRVRSGASRETPQWWGTGSPNSINGLPSGLWTEPVDPDADQRVFYSTTEKATTAQKSGVVLDRLAPRALTRGNRIGELTNDAALPAWNPSLVEITILGCHREPEDDFTGDKPEAYALAMHQLRQAPDYLDSLALPLPLHLAGQAQAYVLPMFTDDADPAADAEADAESDAADVDPDLLEAPGLASEPEPTEQFLPLG
jgi:RNaseH domain of pPIWI_RE